MVAKFTDRHLGKRVIARDGSEVGTVSDVRNGSLYVETDSDADERVVDDLGWDGVVHQTEHRLRSQYISDIDDDQVRLSV